MDKLLGGCIGALVVLIVLGCLIAFPIMWLWNWLCPVLFGLPVITVWQALGLYVLARCFLPAPTK